MPHIHPPMPHIHTPTHDTHTPTHDTHTPTHDTHMPTHDTHSRSRVLVDLNFHLSTPPSLSTHLSMPPFLSTHTSMFVPLLPKCAGGALSPSHADTPMFVPLLPPLGAGGGEQLACVDDCTAWHRAAATQHAIQGHLLYPNRPGGWGAGGAARSRQPGC